MGAKATTKEAMRFEACDHNSENDFAQISAAW